MTCVYYYLIVDIKQTTLNANVQVTSEENMGKWLWDSYGSAEKQSKLLTVP